MLRLTPRQRTLVIDKVPDVANLIFASMFLGPFLTDRPFSLVVAVTGFGIWAALAVFVFVVAEND